MSANKGLLPKGREGGLCPSERMAGKHLPVSGKVWYPGPLNYFSVSRTKGRSWRWVLMSCENILGGQLYVHFSGHREKAI